MQDRAQLQAVATRLVQAGASMEAADLEGRTALHLAAGCGDAAMVSHLLHLGADVNAVDSVGGTEPSHAAIVDTGHRKSVRKGPPDAGARRESSDSCLVLTLYRALQAT